MDGTRLSKLFATLRHRAKNAPRAHVYPWLLVIFFYLPVFIAVWIWVYQSHRMPDFSAFWAAGRLAWSHPALAWDLSEIQKLQGWSPGRPRMPFVNPPPFLLVMAPFGLLPSPAAHLIWFAATAALYFVAARRLLPAGALFALTPVFVNALLGQNGLLTAALMIGGIRQLERRPFCGGLMLGALVIKPQLALLVPVALFAARRWRAVAGAAAGSIGLLGLSLAAFGPAAYLAFLHGSAIARFNLESGANALKMWSVFSAIVASGGGLALAWTMQLAATAVVAAIVAGVWRKPGNLLAQGAVLAAATPLASPYVFAYDLALLALPIGWLAMEGARKGFLPGERGVLGLAAVSPLIAINVAEAGFGFNPGPLVAAALLAVVLRRLASDGAGQIRQGVMSSAEPAR
jgi:hypothetical protein